jgi:predicted small lipoprotein YifL
VPICCADLLLSMAYSVAVIQSGIYAHMQTTKVIFIVLICFSLLNACGLKGPLYLQEDELTDQATSETQAEDNKEEDKKDSTQVPDSIQ